MKTKRVVVKWVLALACIFIALTLTACKKDPKQASLEWNLKTVVKPYEQAGFKNSKWNYAARKALTEFARMRANVLNTNEPWSDIIANNAAAAVQAGCTDPMVNYLYVRFALDRDDNTPETFSDNFYKIASDMENSSYPHVRKFYAAAAALDQMFSTYGGKVSTMQSARDEMSIIGLELQATMQDEANHSMKRLTITLSPRCSKNGPPVP
jgi:hypothetical protein